MGSRTENRTINMYVNGKQVGNSVKQMADSYRKLNNQVKKLDRNSDEYRQGMKKLKVLNSQLKQHRRAIQGVESRWSKLKSIAKTYGPAALAAFAGRAMMGALRESVDLFRQQEKAVAKVEQAIRSTGGAAGRTLRQLKAQATELQQGTLFGDEDILNNVTAQLLTFTNIANTEFDRTQAVALDLSTVLDGDVKSASIQLGKALNDPVANLSALSRSGIQFSEDQKKVIKELATTNRLAEAQGVILTELERQYGGQAKAAAQVDGGLTQLSNKFGDLLEKVGGFILKGAKPFIEAAGQIIDAIDPFFQTVDFGSEKLEEQRIEMNALTGVLHSSSMSLEQEAQVRKELNQIIGPYTDKIVTEKTTKEELRDIQREVNSAMIQEIEIKAKAEVIQEKLNAQVQAQKDVLEAELAVMKFIQNDEASLLVKAAALRPGSGGVLGVLSAEARNAENALADANEQVEFLQQNFGDLGAILREAEGNPVSGNIVPTTTTTTTTDGGDTQEAKRVEMEEMATLEAELGEIMLEVEQSLANRSVEIERIKAAEKKGIRDTDAEDALARQNDLRNGLMASAQVAGDGLLAISRNSSNKKQQALDRAYDKEMATAERRGQDTTAIKRKYASASAKVAHEQAEYEKSIGFTLLAINSGVSISNSIKEASNAGPFPANLAAIAASVGAVIGFISQAKQMFDSAPPPPAYATGVDHAPGGVSLVGETGPELVNLPEGAGVIPAGPSRDLLFGQNAAIDFGSVPDLSGASGGSSMQMVDEFRQMRQEMSQWQSTFRVENVQTDYDEFDERQQANLARVKNVKLAARGTALVN